MSALPVLSSVALGGTFIFPARSSEALLARLDALPKLAAAVTPASRLDIRPSPEMVSSGIRELDALTGGFSRGWLTGRCGPTSFPRAELRLVVGGRRSPARLS